MKSTAIDILIICLIAIPILIGLYMHFFIYFDVVMSPKQKLMTYWPIDIPIILGYLIHLIRKVSKN